MLRCVPAKGVAGSPDRVHDQLVEAFLVRAGSAGTRVRHTHGDRERGGNSVTNVWRRITDIYTKSEINVVRDPQQSPQNNTFDFWNGPFAQGVCRGERQEEGAFAHTSRLLLPIFRRSIVSPHAAPRMHVWKIECTGETQSQCTFC